uniref:Uncharacterized protein n=1 Tax=viral metagenome TaxID=1070528 RepID=A0A6M3JVH4_9ZZZZ
MAGKLEKCPGKTTRGRRCRNPAGYKTDHVGFGYCQDHEQKFGSTGMALQAVSDGYVTKNPNLFVQANKYAEDPDIFDVRRELGTLRALAEELLGQVGKDRADLDKISLLRGVIDTLSKAQERAIRILATKQFFMTFAQVERVIRDLSIIWNEEVDTLIAQNPDWEPTLRAFKTQCSRRVRDEMEVPQMPQTGEPEESK